MLMLVLVGCESLSSEIYQPHSAWQVMRAKFRLTQHNNEAIRKQVAHLGHRYDIFEDAIKHAPPYLHHIVQQCIDKDLPTELALIPMIESGYNPFAHSKAGASGLWQMMPSTASGMKLKINWWEDERRDIVKATDAALDHLKYLHSKFGSWDYAIAAYDAGEGRIRRMLKNRPQGVSVWDLPLPNETQRYMVKIYAARMIINQPSKYGLNLPDIPAKPYFKSITVNKHMDIDAIASDLRLDPKIFRALNASHRRLSTPTNHKTTFYVPTTHYHQAIKLLKKQHSNHLIYRVKENDTLNSIAKKLDSSIELLVSINKLTSNKLVVGQKLIVNRKTGRSAHEHRIISADQVPGPKQHVYIVQKNDTLSSIAAKFNVKTEALIYWNHLKTQKIQHNDRLVIWTTPKGNYTVTQGDTLSKIARAHDVSIAQIKQQNNLTSDTIRIGQKLAIRKEGHA